MNIKSIEFVVAKPDSIDFYKETFSENCISKMITDHIDVNIDFDPDKKVGSGKTIKDTSGNLLYVGEIQIPPFKGKLYPAIQGRINKRSINGSILEDVTIESIGLSTRPNADPTIPSVEFD